MEIAMIGLGRMGANMTKRLLRGSNRCVIYDQNREIMETLRKEGATSLESIEELKEELLSPRVVWVMLPAGAPTENTIRSLAEILEPNDIVIDGGNSNFKDDRRRASELANRNIRYLDVGVSGGVWGLERGYCLMIGGDSRAAADLDPIFRCLAPEDQLVARSGNRANDSSSADRGYLYCGSSGSGHFVKMIHNGIEYGMMEALAEGFDILDHSDYQLDLREIAEVWRRGSVVSSWLLDLIALSLNQDPKLSKFEGFVQDSGEGRWTLQAAIDYSVSIPVIANSLFVRFRSREAHSFAERMLSAMRNEFGGHVEPERKAS